jgi:UDP-N-acetylglucosamine/UDP-N-acetylgalactosamine diphosphorylase
MSEARLLRLAREHFAAASQINVSGVLQAPRDVLPRDVPQSAFFCGHGRQVLRDGRVAVLTLAGGRSTRMGGRFRGDIPVGPVSKRTLLELHGERIAAIRSRHAPKLRWLILTSESTHEPVRQALLRRHHFGLPERDVWLFSQQSLPVLDDHLDPLRLSDGALVCCPTGHGGVLGALRDGGLIDRLALYGVDYLFAFQYPNALERICDPVMLGFHDRNLHDVTVKAFSEVLPGERVGRLVTLAGRTVVIEYHAVTSPEQARLLAPQPMYSGTAVWSLAFLRRCVRTRLELPFHVVPHTEPGQLKQVWKAEQFIFDLLDHSGSTGVVLGRRGGEYATVKSETGIDSAEAARRALTARYRAWLDGANAVGPAKVRRIEISPAYALCSQELRERLPLHFRYDDGLLLDVWAG